LQGAPLSKEVFLAGISPGALSTAILIINNVRDVEEDRHAGKKTVVVRLGKRFGQWEFVGALVLAFLPLLFFYKSHPFSLLALIGVIFALPIARTLFTYRDPRALNPVFGKTGQLLWLFTLLFCIGWML